MSVSPIPYLPFGTPFPPVCQASKEPEGLLAWGYDLSLPTLLTAYRSGIFPWFNALPVLWWSPDPRTVLLPEAFHAPQALRQCLRQGRYRVTIDHAFEAVIRACADTRRDQLGTWITEEMIQAYLSLHKAGWAHSFETWSGRLLVGGLYGVAIGGLFAGESMFSIRDEASRVALYHLVEHMRVCPEAMVDCQFQTAHLQHMGAQEISREVYCARLQHLIDYPSLFDA